jgi:hypothetical protein
MSRLREVRPTSSELARSGTTSGRPGEGIGSGLSWASYQAGSIHTSATQSNFSAGTAIGGASTGGGGATASVGVRSGGASGGASGRGMLPVVKS